jgi:hypothetical protein
MQSFPTGPPTESVAAALSAASAGLGLCQRALHILELLLQLFDQHTRIARVDLALVLMARRGRSEGEASRMDNPKIIERTWQVVQQYNLFFTFSSEQNATSPILDPYIFCG